MEPRKYQTLLRERARLRAERDTLRAEYDAIGENHADATAQARSEALEEQILANAQARDQNDTAIAREELIRNALREAPAEATRIESVRDLEVERPWGSQYQRGAWQVEGSRQREVYLAGALGEQLLAVVARARGLGDDRRLYQAAPQGAGETDNVGRGGFLVQTDVYDDLRTRIMTGQLLSRVRQIPIGENANKVELVLVDESSRATGSRFGGVQGYWVDEGTAATASRPALHKIKLELFRLAALGYVTDELEQDAPSFGALMRDAFVEELRWLAENAILRGVGVGSPLGIIGHAATVSVSKETGQAAATIVKKNVDKMWSRMLGALRSGAIWLINQDCEPELDNMALDVGTGGVPVYLPPGGLSETPFARLKGRPVIPVEYCSTVGTVGDITLVNLDEYGWIDKGGVQSASSMHVAFTTHEQALRATWRIDGRPRWRTTLTPANGSNTLSPFVTLATRS